MKKQTLILLNEDILFLIIEYLEIPDMSFFLLVCKEWNNQLTNKNELKSKLLCKQLLNNFIQKELNNYQYFVNYYFVMRKNGSLKRMFKSFVKQVKYEKQNLQKYDKFNLFTDLKEFFFIYWNKLFNILFSYLKNYDNKQISVYFFTKLLQKPYETEIEINQFVFNEIATLLNKFIKLSKCLLNHEVSQVLYYKDNKLNKLHNLIFEFIFEGIYYNLDKNQEEKIKDVDYLFKIFKPKYSYLMLQNYLNNKLYSFDTFCDIVDNLNFNKSKEIYKLFISQNYLQNKLNSINLTDGLNIEKYPCEIFNLLITQPNLTFIELEQLIDKYFYKNLAENYLYFEQAINHVLVTKEGDLKTKKETAIYLMSLNKIQLSKGLGLLEVNEAVILYNELDNPFKYDFDVLDYYCKNWLNNDITRIENLFLYLKNRKAFEKEKTKAYLNLYFKNNYNVIKSKYFK